MANQQAVREYQVAIVGDRGVGKTTFMRRPVDSDNRRFQITWTLEYPKGVKPNGPTTASRVDYPMDFITNQGPVVFNCWDIANPGLPHCVYSFDYRGADCAIIMYDVTTLLDYGWINVWCHWLREICPGIPIVLCGNKVDLLNGHVEAGQLASCLVRNNLMYCEISALSNYNFEMPFLYLARKLERNEYIHFTEMPALVPPEALRLPNQFKLAILGAGATGKTTFVQRHVNGDNDKFVDPDTGVTVYPLDFQTNVGQKRFNCWDITGLSHDHALQGSHGAIILFDVTERSTYDHVSTLISEINWVCPGIPIVLCGNKVDLQNRNVNARHLAGWLDGNSKYCEISALSNYNFEKPFLYLARKLWNYRYIRFMEAPALVTPRFMIDLEAQRRNELELSAAIYRAQDEFFRVRALPQQAVNDQIYRIAIVGDVPNDGTVYPMDFQTNLGQICLMIRGIGLFLDDSYLAGADGVIIKVDDNSFRYEQVCEWIHEIRSDFPRIPIVLCENKVDLQKRTVFDATQLAGLLTFNNKYCQISQPSNYNIVMPFLFLARMLVSYSVSFTEMPPLAPAEVMLDSEAQRIIGQAFRIRALIPVLKPVLKPVLNRHRDRDPDSPLLDYDVELMKMVKYMMIEKIDLIFGILIPDNLRV